MQQVRHAARVEATITLPLLALQGSMSVSRRVNWFLVGVFMVWIRPVRRSPPLLSPVDVVWK